MADNKDMIDETEQTTKNDEGSDTSLNKAKAALKEAVSWFITIALAIICALLITKFVIFKAEVPTGSMLNTIGIHDRIIAWQLYTSIDRGDIVIFPALDYAGEDCYYVKRVIGLPGETVEEIDGVVYINGVELKEDYLAEETYGNNGPFVVPEGTYFLMGDNRTYSRDARYWDNKYVKKEDIVAKALFRFNPDFKWFKKPDYE